MSNLIIDLEKVKTNTKKIIKKYDNYKYFIAVVKTNAYGLGIDIVPSLIEGGVNYLAVSYLEEALNIRKINKTIPILCLQPILKEELDQAIDNNITITISSLDYLKNINITKKVKAHIKIDSGMNRLGFKTSKELNEAISIISSNDKIELEGLYTHFATIGYIDKLYDKSLEQFNNIVKDVNLATIPIIHFGGSAALIAHKKIPYVNGFRSGILFMGYNISLKENNIGLKNKLRKIRNNTIKKLNGISQTIKNIDLDLKNPVSFYTNVIELKQINKKEHIGYGATYKAKTNMKVAILPIGTSNGIKTNNNRYVIIKNKKYYQVGSTSMNMMIVKVDDNIKVGDKVEIIGDNISLGTFASFNNESIADTLIRLSANSKIYK